MKRFFLNSAAYRAAVSRGFCAALFVLIAAVALPLAAQSFPEGDVAVYIDAVDAVNLPVNCKAKMAVVDTFASGGDRATEGFFVRKDNKVVWVATAPASQKNFALLRSEDTFLRALRDHQQGRENLCNGQREGRRDFKPGPHALQHESRLHGELQG